MKLDDEAPIIWGAQMSDDLEGLVRVMLIITGVSSSQITGMREKKYSAKTERENDLGIEFMD